MMPGFSPPELGTKLRIAVLSQLWLCRVKQQIIIDWSILLIVRHADKYFSRANAAVPIISGEDDMVDPAITSGRTFCAHFSRGCAHTPAVRTGIATARGIHGLVLENAVNHNNDWAPFGVCHVEYIDFNELVVRWPESIKAGPCCCAERW